MTPRSVNDIHFKKLDKNLADSIRVNGNFKAPTNMSTDTRVQHSVQVAACIMQESRGKFCAGEIPSVGITAA